MDTNNIIPKIQDFFNALYGPDPPGYIPLWSKQDKLTQWYRASDFDQMAARCLEMAPYYDVYFGVGLQAEKLTSSKRGTSDSVIAIGAIHVDIDCSGGSHAASNLPTFEEAIQLLNCLPIRPSIIIHTGGGLHCYWLFSKLWIFQNDAKRQECQALVANFQRAMIKLFAARRWKMDNTSDLARVLRVPGTQNLKGNTPHPVKILEFDPDRRYMYRELKEAIATIEGSLPSERDNLHPQNTQNTQKSEDKPIAAAIFEKCAFLRHCRDNAATLPEPSWYTMLSIVARTEEGPALCHELSRPYPGYSVSETDGKIRHALQDTGPVTCERIKSDSPGFCDTCSNKVTSPIVLGLQTRWEKPIALNEYELPKFPTNILPVWLRAYVEAEAQATQTPRDLGGMLALSACACAVAKKVIILVRAGWLEPLNLWTVTALAPGNRKSAVFADIAYPVEQYEQAERDRIVPEIEQVKNRRKILEQSLQQAQSTAAKAKGVEQERFIREAGDIAQKLAEMNVPVIPELIADDCSPEAVAKLLAEQGGRIAIMSPEGDVFDIMGGRYSQGINIGNFLKGHSGDNIRVKRINRAPEYVKNPALTMGLAVQPDVLRGLMEKPGFRGRGLLGRFLYSLPVSPVGYRNTRPPGMPAYIKDNYCRGIRVLLSLPWGTDEEGRPEAHVLRLSHDADVCFGEFEAWLEPQLKPYTELGNIADWTGKLAGAVARIAGILHMAEHINSAAPWSIPVGVKTVEGAVTLARDYLIYHAKAAFAEMGSNPNIEAARCVLDWINRTSKEKFNKRELFNGVRGQKKFSQVKDLDPALSILIEHCYIRVLPGGRERGQMGRSPGAVYEVNPYAQNTQKAQNQNMASENNTFANFANIADVNPEVENVTMNTENAKEPEYGPDDCWN
ncbi:MAG: hypothetical protein A4E53_03284 [Pelotomaculum sp. PtaB.Bin104]|nr:MAG: hypothetical protein A4E53_03284 [Pelotomaculum sp. PtaB.Bin104]